MTATPLRATTALTLILLLASPAAGQNSQRPTVITPPIGNFDINPNPTPRARSSPTPAPTPRPTVTPAPTPRATPSPQPAVSQPAPRPSAAAQPTPQPSPTRFGPSDFTPVATPQPQPSAAAPATQPTPAPDPTDAIQAVIDALPVWALPALGAAAALLVGLVAGLAIAGRRRRRRESEEAEEALVETPVVAAPPTPGPPARAGLASPPAPPRPVPEPAARAQQPAPQPGVAAVVPPPGPLVTEIRPLRAAIRDGVVSIDFELYIQNRGAETADNVRAVLGLFAANPDQDAQIAAFHGAARMAPGSEPFSIAPGGIHMLKGQVTQSGDQMRVVNVQGKPMFVPILPVALKWYAGLSIRTLRDSFMIGTVPAPGSDRLGPLWVERAAEGFGRLAAKRYVPNLSG